MCAKLHTRTRVKINSNRFDGEKNTKCKFFKFKSLYMYGYLGLFEAAFYPVTLGMLSELMELEELGTQKPSGKNLVWQWLYLSA